MQIKVKINLNRTTLKTRDVQIFEYFSLLVNFLKHLVVFTFRIPSVKTINGSKEFNVNLTKITEKKIHNQSKNLGPSRRLEGSCKFWTSNIYIQSMVCRTSKCELFVFGLINNHIYIHILYSTRVNSLVSLSLRGASVEGSPVRKVAIGTCEPTPLSLAGALPPLISSIYSSLSHLSSVSHSSHTSISLSLSKLLANLTHYIFLGVFIVITLQLNFTPFSLSCNHRIGSRFVILFPSLILTTFFPFLSLTKLLIKIQLKIEQITTESDGFSQFFSFDFVTDSF